MMIKNIIFDLGGVILEGKPEDILDKFDIASNDLFYLKKFFLNWHDIDLGFVSLKQKYNSLKYPSNINLYYKDILLNYYKYRNINNKLLDIIHQLKDNYQLYILSDNNMESFEYYKNNLLFNNFHKCIISAFYHKSKIDGKLFDVIIDECKINPKESLFIDDNMNNIITAKNKKFKTLLFVNNSTFLTDIRKYNIEL